jgi:signal transduction histidine kinase
MADRLFESMVSVRSPAAKVQTTGRAKSEPHLGLGLFIVRLIAEFHRGAVRARNRDDGRGVTIEVSFPLAAAPI